MLARCLVASIDRNGFGDDSFLPLECHYFFHNNWTGASWFQSQCHWLLQRNFEAGRIGVHICIMCGKELTRKTPLQGVYTVYTVYIDIRYRYRLIYRYMILYDYICVSPGTKWKTQQQSPSVWRVPPLSPILTYLIRRCVEPNHTKPSDLHSRCVEELASLSEPLSSSSCLQILEMEGSLSETFLARLITFLARASEGKERKGFYDTPGAL